MDLLALIPTGIKDVTTRIAAALALWALVVYLAGSRGVELSNQVYLLGIYGACFVLVSFSMFMYSKFEKWLKRRNKIKQKQAFALKNLEIASAEYVAVLKYLKANKLQRFRDNPDNWLLHHMERACLLDIDDINISIYVDTYLMVPKYVWKRIDDIPWFQPILRDPPWKAYNPRIS